MRIRICALLAVAVLAAVSSAGVSGAHSDPNALWDIVHDSCVPDQEQHGDIHIDCVRADVHEALTRHAAEIGVGSTPFPVPLAGHYYSAIAVSGEDLDAVNPFTLLADGVAGARHDMGDETIVVVGAMSAEGRPGFVVLADQADAANGDRASGESLQDHISCPAPLPANGQ